jgi:hypothetical protein
MTIESLKTTAVLLVFLIVALAVNNHLVTTKVTNRVLESLKRDYTPGPYEPGFDPDKVPPRTPQR